MQSNFTHMLTVICAFLIVNLLFMIMLFLYRYYRRNPSTQFSLIEKKLLQGNFVKICAVFAAIYFSVAIFYNHRKVPCDKLDKDAICQCYALEMIHHKALDNKLLWANKGMQACPDSQFFHDYINSHPVLTCMRQP